MNLNWASSLRRAPAKTPGTIFRIFLVLKDSRTPLKAKLLSLVMAVYLLSPLDLITDIIPVLGILDDLLVIPMMFWLFLKCLPPGLWEEYEERSAHVLPRTKKIILTAVMIFIAFWSLSLGAIFYFSAQW
ncbi:MAG: DUF1232 domain-containing protein [Hahellaceae bacterium]|nr:DUF1232 domain-containing protein [Hahellaceae bacterium]